MADIRLAGRYTTHALKIALRHRLLRINDMIRQRRKDKGMQETITLTDLKSDRRTTDKLLSRVVELEKEFNLEKYEICLKEYTTPNLLCL